MLMFGCATIILMMEQSQMRQGGARYENVQKLLYEKYSSTQTYFYTNKINEIIKEKHTAVNIFYEDVEYLLDLEENLKRWYLQKEFEGKMFTFKEYYFYHQDCPRIFLKGIQDPYAKWQDRRRDLVYKQLKIAYNQSYSSADSRNEDQKSENQVAISHFLLEISDYNPYSKKYYLRVEARKEKERKKAEQMKKNHESKRDIEDLKQDLSAMLNDISQLSDISGLSVATPKHYDKYKSQKYTTISIKKSEDRSGSSTNLSNSNSLIRFNFKKNKGSAEKLALPRQLKPSRQKDRKSSSKDKERRGNEQRLSPRYSSNQMPSDLIKSKSIFSVSSFGALRQTDLKNTGLLNTGKKEQLKLNFQSKKSVQDEKKYQTEKKRDPSQGQGKNIVIKTKSTSKFEPKLSLEKFKSKDMSAGKGRNDQFSDKKMSEAQSALRMRSLKSQYVSSSKKALLSIKPTLQLQKGKRLLEIRNW